MVRNVLTVNILREEASLDHIHTPSELEMPKLNSKLRKFWFSELNHFHLNEEELKTSYISIQNTLGRLFLKNYFIFFIFN